MHWLAKIIFVAIFVFSLYHLARDVLQTFNLESAFTDVMHRSHAWCGDYCDIVTWPLDIAGVIVAGLVLRRNKVGTIGVVLLTMLLLWPLFTLLP